MFKRTFWQKYNNKKIIIDNIKFNSKLEANSYLYLKDIYKIIEFEPCFELQNKFKYEWKIIRNIIYKSDFLILLHNNKYWVIEIKWFKTPEYKLKRKLFLYKLKDFEKEMNCQLVFIEAKSLRDLKEQLNKI